MTTKELSKFNVRSEIRYSAIASVIAYTEYCFYTKDGLPYFLDKNVGYKLDWGVYSIRILNGDLLTLKEKKFLERDL